MDQRFESYAAACGKVIAATKDRMEKLKQEIGLLEVMRAEREASKP